MLTAIILTAAIVIAVVVLALFKESSKWSRIEESTEWARKWNEQWSKKDGNKLLTMWCDNKCNKCDADRCPFREVEE